VPELDKGVETPGGFRVTTDTLRRRLGWLIALSVLLHTILTPLAGWLGLASSWLSEPEEPPPPLEELEGIPVELWEQEEQAPPATEPAQLPSEDPVDVIEELIAVPEAALPKPAPPKSPKPEPEQEPEPKPTTQPSATAPAPTSAPAPSASANPASSDHPPGDAGAAQTSVESDAGSKSKKGSPKRTSIESPVALVGPTADLVKSNAKLQLVLYADRIREHALGERIARLLPTLPQWNDFFEGGTINPIRDFDRFFVAGPSFYYSDQLFIALQYNTARRNVHRAIDNLVKRGGRWLADAPVPAALAVADRAERLFVMPPSKMVFVAPPALRNQVFKLGGTNLPNGRGDEALVATIKNPKKSLYFLRVNIPESISDVRIRVTPLPKGAVGLELTAKAPDAATAQSTSRRIEGELNAQLELLSGVSDLLGRFGFGALTRGMAMPRVRLRPNGNLITSSVKLDAAQVNFILDRVENLLVARAQRSNARATAGAPSAGNTPRLPSSSNAPPRPVTSPKPTPSAGTKR